MTLTSKNDINIAFAPLSAEPGDSVLVVLASQGASLSKTIQALDERAGGGLGAAIEAADFKGKAKSSIEVLAPRGLGDVNRVLIVGVGKVDKTDEPDWVNIGGSIISRISARPAKTASLIVEFDGDAKQSNHNIAAAIAGGIQLRNYKFDKYKTDSKDTGDDDNGSDDKKNGFEQLTVHCEKPDKAEEVFASHRAVARGVHFARDLVNEPANTLSPEEFADRAKSLEDLGLDVEVLTQKDITKHKMGALLSVSQGSERPPRVVIMKWNGAKKKSEKPIAFVGKGVVFDTGGISIKPAQGMGDMKGDMGGAACVTGLMYALAARKAKVNAVGIIGCVENMPSGTATRPGDIVTSMAGKTIEVLNTDAEGRLVLADCLWYIQEHFEPKLAIDLATLTGAIMIALGKEYAGVFANDDDLAEKIAKASKSSGEKTWRMPLDKSFSKLIDTPNADVKNLGGRWAGACTAAAFIERFVKKDQTWAHIDLAGPAMDAPRSDINPSWGSGWGVRLLNKFVEENYEK